jgi:holliday junction DNA helicase RuvA
LFRSALTIDCRRSAPKSNMEIRQIVREDALLLYGFAAPAEKQAFDLLMGVQHVGAKLALAVLSVLSPQELAAAITQEDVERIDAAPGVGAKVAERIVRELRDKIGGLNLIAPERAVTASANGQTQRESLADDAVSALVNLGYKQRRPSARLTPLMALMKRTVSKF